MRLRFLLPASLLALSLASTYASGQLTTTQFSQANGNAAPAVLVPTVPCASYVAITTDSNGNSTCLTAPSIALTAQTAAIPSTVLCTAAACPAGMYQVTVNMVPTTLATVGTAGATVTFTDDAQAQSVALITNLSLVSKNPSGATYVLYSTGVVPISLSTSLTSVTGSPAYSFRASIRRLF